MFKVEGTYKWDSTPMFAFYETLEAAIKAAEEFLAEDWGFKDTKRVIIIDNETGELLWKKIRSSLMIADNNRGVRALYEIYLNILTGAKYGYYSEPTNPVLGEEPIWHTVLSCSWDNQYICWSHFGSGANRRNIKALKFILYKIFDMTAVEFVKTYKIQK